jgi:hypothetical protein
MTADVTISCPHCRRQYAMKIDPERLQRLKTRATCGRCGKTFDAASRILAAQQQAPVEAKPRAASISGTVSETKRTDPRLPQLTPVARKLPGVATPDVRDEMEELAREFAEAAARFTPVGIKRSAVGIGSGIGGGVVALGDAPATTKPANVEEPTNPGVVHASVAAAAAASADSVALASAAPLSSDVSAALDQLSLDAEPAGEEEFPAVPTLSRAPAAPRSWLEVSDPGLAALLSPPSAGAAALEALLNEGESIALPPPPTAS